MAAPTTDLTGDVCDPTPDFVYAVSLLAALEATEQDGHARVLPFLGMARAELVDFGQRLPDRFVEIEVTTLGDGMRDLEARLTDMVSASAVLQQTLRLQAARRHVRRALTASSSAGATHLASTLTV
ncbi:hypothetical protein [Nocardioides sp. CF8]|uniref:hypothetical protein n=1 Tax=Nocardioides sp. CF8 TaxID=110319 RepID=UPI0006869E5A|nr:hypothetical protein [Nocardioides sp. CF8]